MGKKKKARELELSTYKSALEKISKHKGVGFHLVNYTAVKDLAERALKWK